MAGGNEAVRQKRGGGPKTEEGKARSSRNALKHGLRAVKHVFSDEDADLFQEYRIELMHELRPVGTVETALADRIAQAIWRLRRIMSIEAEMFDRERMQPDGSLCTLGEVFARPSFGGPRGVVKLIRYETALERGLNQSLRQLRLEQAARKEREEADAEAGGGRWNAASELLFPPLGVPRPQRPGKDAETRRGGEETGAEERGRQTGGTQARAGERGSASPSGARVVGGGSVAGYANVTELSEISKRTPAPGHNGSRPGGIPPAQRA